MYKGEVNVYQEELPNFLKTAELLQVKGLTSSESQVLYIQNPRKVVFQYGSFHITTTAVCRSSDFKCKDDISHFTLGLQVS